MQVNQTSYAGLRRILKNVWASGYNDRQLAEIAGLNTSTVWYLRNETTKLPRYQTVERLCFAAGFMLLCQQRAGGRPRLRVRGA